MSGAGGERDFSRVYDEHVWDVYGFFAYRLRSRGDVEDLTQTTFERALKAWSRYDPTRASPRTWLMSIAGNLLIDHFRADKSRRQAPLDDDALPESAMPRAAGPEEDLGLDPSLAAAVADLKPREREAIALRFGADLTAREIAEHMDLSVANVQQILSRALRRIRASLQPVGQRVGDT